MNAEDPAIPPIARIRYTPMRYPWGRKSNSIAVMMEEKKLLKAITSTDLWRGYLSKMMPIGISVIRTGMNDEK